MALKYYTVDENTFNIVDDDGKILFKSDEVKNPYFICQILNCALETAYNAGWTDGSKVLA